MTDEKVRLLNALSFVWNAQDIVFEEEHRHVFVKQRYKTEEGLPLGAWVSTQRREWKKKQNGKHGQITDERVRLLDALGFAWKLRGEEC